MARPRAQEAEDTQGEIEQPSMTDAIAALTSVAQGLGAIVTQQEAIRQKKVHEIAHDTAWSPDVRKHKLRKYTAFYQNHARVHTDRMSPMDVALVDQLKPGKYNHKKWDVVKTTDGGISINYSNKTSAHRSELTADVNRHRVEGGSGLTAMLQMIVTEQEAQAEAKKRRGYASDDDE